MPSLMKVQISHRARRIPVYVSLNSQVLDEARVRADFESRTLSNLVEYALKLYIHANGSQIRVSACSQQIEDQEVNQL